jgi:phage terminase large subunit
MIKKFRRFFQNNPDKRLLILYGGSGGGKSYATLQWLIEQLITRPRVKIIVLRKTGPSMKLLTMPVIDEIIENWGLWDRGMDLNKSDRVYSWGHNKMMCRSLDDPEKFKGGEGDIILLEETTEFTWLDYTTLDIRLARTIENPQLIMTFNPVDAYHWVIQELVDKPDPSMAILHSTYKDNRHLAKSFVNQLKSYEKKDSNFYRVYTLGLPGVLKAIVYSNWEVVDRRLWPRKIRERWPQKYGMDFGYNDPNACVSMWQEPDVLYVHEEFYETEQTTSDMLMTMKEVGIQRGKPIYCENDPDTIEAMSRKGYNAQSAKKGKIFPGIQYLQNLKIVVSPESLNMIKEFRNYKFQEDKKTGRVFDEPVDAFNHCMDCMRYGAFSDPVLQDTAGNMNILHHELQRPINIPSPNSFYNRSDDDDIFR